MTNEEKQTKFKVIATRRVNQILKGIESLKAFRNTSFYEYKPEQMKAIFKALYKSLREVEHYYSKPRKEKGDFTL